MRKKILALFLAFTFLTSGLSFFGVQAEDDFISTSASYVYPDYAGTDWSYDYVSEGSSNYLPLTVFLADYGWWFGPNGSWSTSGINNGRIHPNGGYDGAFTYTAPNGGLVTLTSPSYLIISNSASPGVYVAVYKNNTKIWPLDASWDYVGHNSNKSFPTVTTAVKSGDKLHFRVSAQGAGGSMDMAFDPAVTYTSYEYDPELDLEEQQQAFPAPAKADGAIYDAYQPGAFNGGWTYESRRLADGPFDFKAVNSFNYWWWHYNENAGENNLWGDTAAINREFLTPTPSADAALMYTLPKDGTVTLSADRFSISTGPGYNVAVYKNNVKVWPESGEFLLVTPTNNAVFEPVTFSAKAYDKIRFVISSNGSEDNGFYFVPVVSYENLDYDPELDPEVTAKGKSYYNSAEQFGDAQGPVWWYLFTPINDDVTFQQPDYTSGGWRSGTGWTTGLVGRGIMQPGADYDVILAFRAPYTGQITVSVDQNNVRLQNSVGANDAGDGVEFGIFKSSQGEISKLWPETAGSAMQYIPNGGTAALEPFVINIQKNEFIWFRSNRGPATDWHDSITVNPVIEYLTMNEDDPGVPDTPVVIERVKRGAGSNLESGVFPMTGRVFDNNTAIEKTSAEISSALIGGTLEAGVYKISGGGRLNIHGTGMNANNKTIDASGIKIIVEPAEGEPGRFGMLIDSAVNLTINNLTLEFTGAVREAGVQLWNSGGITLKNLEIIDSTTPSNSQRALIETVGNNPVYGEIIIDGLRFAGSGSGNFNRIAFGSGIDAYPTVKNSYIDGLSGGITDNGSTGGAWIENNIIKNAGTAVTLGADNGSALYNTISNAVTGITSSGKTNILAAKNDISVSCENPVIFENMTNAVVLLNKLHKVKASGTNITAAENSNDNGALTIDVSNSNYALINENKDLVLIRDNTENIYGSDIPAIGDYATSGVNGKGADESLLPVINTELFAFMPRKDEVHYGGRSAPLSTYLNRTAREYEDVIIPPGAYNTGAFTVANDSNLNIYAYGVLGVFESFRRAAVSVSNSEKITLKGLVIDHEEIATGQATLTARTGNTATFTADAGFLQDFLDTSRFSVSDRTQTSGTLGAIQGFLKADGNIPYADMGLRFTRTDTPGVFTADLNTNVSRRLQVDDKITIRALGSHVMYFGGSSELVLEDVTILNGSGFGIMEWGGDKATYVNRLAVVPGPAPVLPDGSRGPDRLISTCDATHSTNMREGIRVENSVFRQMTDDATNVNAEYGTVTQYDASAKTLTFGPGIGRFSGNIIPPKTGDRILVYTKLGRLVCDSLAAADAVSIGNNRFTLQLENELNEYPAMSADMAANDLVIQNWSASGNYFYFKNCLMDNNRSRGFLIKASHGEISNCTILNNGMSAILVKPEIEDGWSECGYVEDFLIKDNYIANSGFFTGSVLHSPINISGDGQNTSDPLFLGHKDIIIQGNIIAGRNTDYAISANGVQGLKILENDLGYKKGSTQETDTLPGVYLNGVYDVEVSDNIYPPNAEPKVRISATSAMIYGTDVGKIISDYISVSMDNIIKNNEWYLRLTITGKTTELSEGTIEVLPATTEGLLALPELKNFSVLQGETAVIEYAISAPVNGANVSLRIALTGGPGEDAQSVISQVLSFNAAIKTTKPLNWNIAAPLTAEADSEHGASLKFLWDDEYLYMYAEVADPDHSQPYSGENIWNGANIQFALEPGRTAGITGQLEVGFALNDAGNIQQWCWGNTVSAYTGDLTGRGFDVNIERLDEDNITIYQIAMPWAFIGSSGAAPEDGSAVAFNVCVNYIEDGSRKFYEFYGGIAENKNASEFGLLSMYAGEQFTAEAAALRDALLRVTELLADVKTVLAKPRGNNITANLWANALTAFVPRLEDFDAAAAVWDGEETVIIDGITFAASDVNNWTANVKNIFNLLNAIV
ncbi:MAG: hypothetical protein FWH24_03305 [Oscillospiraceae bacterium]|nr:hypothetical protein [Oscillospiraceae bacterium]